MACLFVKNCFLDDSNENYFEPIPKSVQPKCESLVPYLFIRKMEPDAYLDLQQRSLIAVSRQIGKLEDFSTSCSYNLIALMTLFSGIDKAKWIYKRLMMSGCYCFSFDSGDQTLKYQLKVDDLFTGRCIAKFGLPIEQEVPKIFFKAKMSEFALEFFHSLNPTLSDCFKNELGDLETSLQKVEPKINSFIKKVDYSFNKEVIDEILADFHRNGSELSERVSFVYYFVIGSNFLGLYHAFCLEQFFCSKEPRGLFRIYQSWIHQMTLSEYFTRKGYDLGVQGCVCFEEISKLFRDIDLIFLNRNATSAPSKEELSELHQRTFDVALNLQFTPVYFLSKEKTLGGLSLRYVFDKIRPSDCVGNVHQFMSR